jgi:hypothetical protein
MQGFAFPVTQHLLNKFPDLEDAVSGSVAFGVHPSTRSNLDFREVVRAVAANGYASTVCRSHQLSFGAKRLNHVHTRGPNRRQHRGSHSDHQQQNCGNSYGQ